MNSEKRPPVCREGYRVSTGETPRSTDIQKSALTLH
jgi:hypothetical protein